VTFDELRAIALAFPGVGDHVTHGTPSLKVGTKFVLREREPGIVAMRVPSLDERDILLDTQSDLYFITDHFRDYPYVLFRLDGMDPARFSVLFERTWRELATKRLIAMRDSEGKA
jgi:hypothetical protein